MSCDAGLMVLKWPLRWTLTTGSFTTTFAPSSARRRATARPMPRPAPVTTAERPLSLSVIDGSFLGGLNPGTTSASGSHDPPRLARQIPSRRGRLGPAGVVVEAGVEEAPRVVEGSSFEEVDLQVVFKGSESENVALGGPDWSSPFPVFAQLGVGFVDQLPQGGHSLASPIGEVGDLLVDLFGGSGHVNGCRVFGAHQATPLLRLTGRLTHRSPRPRFLRGMAGLFEGVVSLRMTGRGAVAVHSGTSMLRPGTSSSSGGGAGLRVPSRRLGTALESSSRDHMPGLKAVRQWVGCWRRATVPA